MAAPASVEAPGGGGNRAAREIRHRSPGTRILAFSAYDDSDAMTQMRLVGVTEYLKGATNVEILSTIRRLGQRVGG